MNKNTDLLSLFLFLESGMRLGMILMWALALVSSVLLGTVECYQQNRENRDKPRATRGFKPLELSTARGFGKRGASSDFIAPSEPSQYLDRDRYVFIYHWDL